MRDHIGNVLRKRADASLTVEAAFIMPMGIAVVLLVVFWCFISYDRVVLCIGVHETLLGEAFVKYYEEDESNEDLADSFAVTVSELCIETDSTILKTTVSGTESTKIMSLFAGRLFGTADPSYENEESTPLLYGEDIVRLTGR